MYMRITVIGSTSPTGLEVLRNGIARGDELVAFTRRPNVLKSFQGITKIVTGDGIHLSDLQHAINGSEGVIAIVGGKANVAAVIQNVIQAMQEAKVRRLVFVSSYLLEAKRPWPTVLVARWIFRRDLAELREAENVIRSCGLNWTIYRPTQLNDKPATGRWRIQERGNDFKSGPYQISRADLAAALLDAVTKDAYDRGIYSVTWGK
jgi:putative NADH-flavin reductase